MVLHRNAKLELAGRFALVQSIEGQESTILSLNNTLYHRGHADPAARLHSSGGIRRRRQPPTARRLSPAIPLQAQTSGPSRLRTTRDSGSRGTRRWSAKRAAPDDS